MKKYLIRLDDACPRMDVTQWDKFEKLFDTYNIKPIIAVVPNNEDTSLMPDKYDNEFWNKVKHWQAKGWEIALHGYNHVYTTKKIGIIPKNNFSEFAGVAISEQSNKIKKGVAIFNQHSINTRTWIAPAHSFDRNTLTALKDNTDISIICDGFSFKPYLKDQFLWIPAQIQECRKVRWSGIWTFCFHPNYTTAADFETLCRFVKENNDSFISVEDALAFKGNRNYLDYLYFFCQAAHNYLRILLGRNH